LKQNAKERNKATQVKDDQHTREAETGSDAVTNEYRTKTEITKQRAKMPTSPKKTGQKNPQCGTCDKVIKEEEELSLTCDGFCKNEHHKECIGLTQGEFDMIRRKNRKLSWLCDKCTDALTKVEKETGRKEDENEQRENITAKVDYIMDFLANELGPLIEDKINHSLTRKTEPSKRETGITNSNKKTASNESRDIYKDYEEHQRPAEERENTEKEEKRSRMENTATKRTRIQSQTRNPGKNHYRHKK
ncbi:hypothetical protein ANN_10204, partial [Periplaneta americana]